MSACKYYDPTCPCQDGDQCHYESYGDSPGIDPRVLLLARIELVTAQRDVLWLAINKAIGRVEII